MGLDDEQVSGDQSKNASKDGNVQSGRAYIKSNRRNSQFSTAQSTLVFTGYSIVLGSVTINL